MTCQQPAQTLRLREKLLIQGAQSLSDTEVLAVFISSG
jgi:DNA repair protein RadC